MDEQHGARRLTVRIGKACDMTGIGRTKFYELIHDGEIEVIKVGAMTLVPIASLEAFIASRRMQQ